MNLKGENCITHMLQHLAGMNERMDNSCKRRAECLCRSLVIVNTEYGQWQASFIQEKSVCLVEVSVTEQILRKFPEILGELSMCKQCVQGSLFFADTQDPGIEAKESWYVLCLLVLDWGEIEHEQNSHFK